MEQFELFSLPNPCINVCEANNRGYCKGCLRSREERQLWLRLNDSQKRQVLKRLRARRIKLENIARERAQQTIELPEQLDFDF